MSTVSLPALLVGETTFFAALNGTEAISTSELASVKDQPNCLGRTGQTKHRNPLFIEKITGVSREKIIGASSPFQVNSNRPGWVSLTVSPTLQSKERVSDIFRAHLDALPPDLAERLLLAVDELLSNAIEHGCDSDPNCKVDVSLIRTERIILIYVRDEGHGFSVANLFHSALNNPPDNPLKHTEARDQLGLRPGGFGILLAKQVADELLYNESGNAVLLIKYLSPDLRVP